VRQQTVFFPLLTRSLFDKAFSSGFFAQFITIHWCFADAESQPPFIVGPRTGFSSAPNKSALQSFLSDSIRPLQCDMMNASLFIAVF